MTDLDRLATGEAIELIGACEDTHERSFIIRSRDGSGFTHIRSDSKKQINRAWAENYINWSHIQNKVRAVKARCFQKGDFNYEVTEMECPECEESFNTSEQSTHCGCESDPLISHINYPTIETPGDGPFITIAEFDSATSFVDLYVHI